MTNRLIDLMSDEQKKRRKPLTVAQLARDLGVSRQYIYEWLNDDLEFYSKAMIDRICDYFDVEPGDLIVREPKASEANPQPEPEPGG